MVDRGRCSEAGAVPLIHPASRGCIGTWSLATWLIALAVLAVAFTASASSSARAQSLPDPSRTPGALNPAVTPETIGETICVRGWTRSVRPDREYTSALKRAQLRAWGYQDRRPSAYEEDHEIPLDLGGAPSDPRNLWPEPRNPADGWSADRKDELEIVLNRLVCMGRLSLDEAQRAIAEDWIAAYRRFIIGQAAEVRF